MHWTQFVVSILDATAWPAAVLAAIILLRKELIGLIGRIGKMKYKDIEIDFHDVELRAQEIKSERLGRADQDEKHLEDQKKAPIIQTKAWPTSLEGEILDLTVISPYAAIMMAWSTLDASMNETIKRIAPEEASIIRTPVHAISWFSEHEFITKEQEEILGKLRKIRNTVAHTHPDKMALSPEHSLDYAVVALDMARHFDRFG